MLRCFRLEVVKIVWHVGSTFGMSARHEKLGFVGLLIVWYAVVLIPFHQQIHFHSAGGGW